MRVIAATNENLADAVEAGKFRSDLYYRLNVFPVQIPPLRERLEDLPLLAEHFLQKFHLQYHKRTLGLSDKALELCLSYAWPGNIRELENRIERQVILSQGDKLVLDDLPHHLQLRPQAVKTTGDTVTEQDCRQVQYQAMVDALARCGGKIYGADGAAQLLGIKPTTLSSRLKKSGINRQPFLMASLQ